MKKYRIATANTRRAKIWKNIDVTFEDLIQRLKTPNRTSETKGEYKTLSKTKQDVIKDAGGYVGGYLKEGKRNNGSLCYRSLLTLDLDYAEVGTEDILDLTFNYKYILHSTRNHEKDKPRYRLIIPLNRNCSADEYEAVGRYIANEIGIDMFDDTTYQANRLMYYPSVSQDQEYVFKSNVEGVEINVDEVLNLYEDWKDRSTWFTSSRLPNIITKEIKKQKDPTEKSGVVGAFCRVYDIHKAIESFLGEVYIRCDIGDRYTYKEGSTCGGAVVYENGDFIYSNHATDPINCKLCNAFDLVRLHKFGGLDEDVKDSTPSNRLPSYLAMQEFAISDKAVKTLIQKERFENARADFEDLGDLDENIEWLSKLETDKRGKNLQTINNVALILTNDTKLKSKIAYNEFYGRIYIKDKIFWDTKESERSWDDTDTSNLLNYIEKMYGINKENAIKHGLKLIAKTNSYHPIRDYIQKLKWDGVKRVETSLIDYLGAENNDYVKGVTKITFIGAVERIFKPGCKFDTVLVLISKQGIGKSTFVRKIGVNWGSESFTTFKGKEACEQIQGNWIIEFAELAAMKKAEVEIIKHFISKASDNFRGAYAEFSKDNPRQCIFIGTSNTNDFLKDATGDRRFYPVDLINKPIRSVKNELTEYEVGQLWAEAYQMYLKGEKSYIEDYKVLELAEEERKAHREDHPYQSIIENYLSIPITEDWQTKSIPERINYLRSVKSNDPITQKGTIKRQKVCILEIWIEALNGSMKELDRYRNNEIKNCVLKIDGWEWHKNPLHFGGDYGRQRGFIKF